MITAKTKQRDPAKEAVGANLHDDFHFDDVPRGVAMRLRRSGCRAVVAS